MSIEVLDIGIFLEGGLQLIVLIVLGLIAATTVFSFLLWQKGDESMLNRFIGYLCATIGLVGGFIAAMQFVGHGSEEVFLGGAFLFIFATLGALGFRLFFFIWDKWIQPKEAKA